MAAYLTSGIIRNIALCRATLSLIAEKSMIDRAGHHSSHSQSSLNSPLVGITRIHTRYRTRHVTLFLRNLHFHPWFSPCFSKRLRVMNQGIENRRVFWILLIQQQGSREEWEETWCAMFRETTANCGFELLAIVKHGGEGEKLRDVCGYKRFTITLSCRQVEA